MEEKFNQISCGRTRIDWRAGDTVLIDSLRLTDKQKQAIRNGHTIQSKDGHWTFSPLPSA